MSEESLQAQISALPREHAPLPYLVLIFDKRNKLIATRYVRASSLKRAVLTGIKVNKYLFGNNKTFRAAASPEGWTMDWLINNRPDLLHAVAV